jgi:hypothetical protein
MFREVAEDIVFLYSQDQKKPLKTSKSGNPKKKKKVKESSKL